MASAAEESLYELQEYLESLLNEAEGKSPQNRWREALHHVAAHIAGTFKVTESEVAVLLKTRSGQELKFAYPPRLALGANMFPLKVWSFAGNITKTATGAFDNAFTEKRHLHIYEHIKVDGPKSGPIHKIIAAPLKFEGEVFGVVEVSRKGPNAAEAGPDFNSADLALLYDIVNRVASYLGSLKSVAADSKSPAS